MLLGIARHMCAPLMPHKKTLQHLMKIDDWYLVLIKSGMETRNLSFAFMEDQIWTIQQTKMIGEAFLEFEISMS